MHKFLFSGDEVLIQNGQLSYGAGSRLMLACLVASQCNLLLLDEPINHLDIPSRLRFEQALSVYKGTVIAVAHDRYFSENFATAILGAEGWGAESNPLKTLTLFGWPFSNIGGPCGHPDLTGMDEPPELHGNREQPTSCEPV